MKTMNKDKMKSITIFILAGLLTIAVVSANMSDTRFRSEARENIQLQEELQKVKEDPIAIYTNKVREAANLYDQYVWDETHYNDMLINIRELKQAIQDKKFCLEVQLNRVVNFEDVEEWFCDNPENIEELKKL